jgi:chromosome segregation ATPase
MIEPIMFVGIGFLVAGLLVIGVIPLVHARAVRLTQRRIEAATPMSMAEIRADKDQLRAEFAMSTRRLEMSVEQMKAKTTSQLADIGKKSEAISRLKLELGEKTAALIALEAREAQISEDLRQTEAELAARASTLEEAERKLAETSADLAKYTDTVLENSLTAESQRVEIIALRAQADVLNGQIESYERETRELHDRLARDTAEAEQTSRQLAEERVKTESLGNRLAELEQQLAAQTTEAQLLDRRVQELVSHLDEQGRFLAEHQSSADLLSKEAALAKKNEADLRAALAEAENERQQAVESLSAAKTELEKQLAQSLDERAKLLREIETIKREAEATWAAERMENAVMRERINDVAAEVARLTSVLEGPTSPIDAILAADSDVPHSGANGNRTGDKLRAATPDGGESSKGSLADRIRALQSRTARVPQPSGA